MNRIIKFMRRLFSKINKPTIRQFNQTYQVFHKIRLVMFSCKTVEQLNNAKNWGIRVVKKLNCNNTCKQCYYSSIETISNKVKLKLHETVQ